LVLLFSDFAAVCWLIGSSRVFEDDEEWFREIFAGSKKEEAIQNQYEFIVQRMGGPPLFSQRRGTYVMYCHSFNSVAPCDLLD
jgi:truncated hemoglobin YjbI